MEDRISREAKLNVAKEIVTTYIRSAVVKNGESQRLEMSAEDVCRLFQQVYQAVDETVPNPERRVGLGL